MESFKTELFASDMEECRESYPNTSTILFPSSVNS